MRMIFLALVLAAAVLAQVPAESTTSTPATAQWQDFAAELERMRTNADESQRLTAEALESSKTESEHQHLRDDFAAVTNLQAFAPGAFVLASVAQHTTDWQFTLRGKQYRISAQRAVAITGGLVGVGMALRHLVPKTRKWVDTALLIGAGYAAGRAYVNTLRNSPAAAAAPATP